LEPWIGASAGRQQFYDLSGFWDFGDQIGLRPEVFLYFAPLTQLWNGIRMSAVYETGAIPMATLALRQFGVLQRIARGDLDRPIRLAAASALNNTLVVRPFHEMNGRFGEPWGAQDPGEFRSAWRRIHRIWRGVGNDAEFCWCPNVVLSSGNGTAPIAEYYPGDEFCDLVGLDGYPSKYADLRFDELFSDSLATLASISRHPIVVGEVGYPAELGSQPRFIEEMFSYLAALPLGRRIIGLNYFHREAWSLTPEGAAAFGEGVRHWRAAYARDELR
jgi:hypothetical protein